MGEDKWVHRLSCPDCDKQAGICWECAKSPCRHKCGVCGKSWSNYHQCARALAKALGEAAQAVEDANG